jgi:UBX domain-containing protein 1/4
VQGALEWLEKNQDTPLEEVLAAESKQQEDGDEDGPALKEGEVPRSLVCNECGKKFRSQAQAEFHASKTEHTDFAESTEEVAPLTEEEKAAKLELLRAKLAEKRAGESEQDKLERKRNEVSIT